MTLAVTVKLDALAAVPAVVVTAIGPVVAAAGTLVLIDVAETTVNGAERPLNLTDDAPLKFAPEIVTVVAVGPLVGVKATIAGGSAPVAVAERKELLAVFQCVAR